MVVGLEVHVQLKTATKIFCRCSTDFGAPPNANTCPVCLALPGALPVLNEHAVELAIRAALALGCEVQHDVDLRAQELLLSRPAEGIPDLAIRQAARDEGPRARSAIERTARRSRIGITRVHMEEDAGKSVHDRFPGATAIDLNRAGVPLVEIVSEPDIRGAAEAGRVPRGAQADPRVRRRERRQHGGGKPSRRREHQRAPRGETKLGTKTEVKNMNSFSGVVRALEVEFARQCAVLDAGGRIEQQTMLWDANARRGAPGAIEGRKPRLSLLPRARSSAARRSARAHRAHRATRCPSCRTRAARAIAASTPRSPTTTSTCSPRAPRVGDYFEQRRAAERRSEDGRELDDGRGARRAEGNGAVDRRISRCGRRTSPRCSRMVRDGRRQPQRREADLRVDGEDRRSAGDDRRA